MTENLNDRTKLYKIGAYVSHTGIFCSLRFLSIVHLFLLRASSKIMHPSIDDLNRFNQINNWYRDEN